MPTAIHRRPAGGLVLAALTVATLSLSGCESLSEFNDDLARYSEDENARRQGPQAVAALQRRREWQDLPAQPQSRGKPSDRGTTLRCTLGRTVADHRITGSEWFVRVPGSGWQPRYCNIGNRRQGQDVAETSCQLGGGVVQSSTRLDNAFGGSYVIETIDLGSLDYRTSTRFGPNGALQRRQGRCEALDG